MPFSEQDWKHLSRLKPMALERLCRHILDEAQAIITGAAEGEHHRVYLALYRHIHERDQLIADGFNDWSRLRHWPPGRLAPTWPHYRRGIRRVQPGARASVELWLSGLQQRGVLPDSDHP
ncbi:MAG: hypothetical protein HZY76_23470 [Anaerolineae bacterium]|nr:MAG: hypothetical protein HZY76_23470 [Anaerolineae bacterium]